MNQTNIEHIGRNELMHSLGIKREKERIFLWKKLQEVIPGAFFATIPRTYLKVEYFPVALEKGQVLIGEYRMRVGNIISK